MICPATYWHNQMLVDLAHAVTDKAGGDVTPKRRLRQNRATNGIVYDNHVPDGLLRIKGKMPVAIELELTAKSRARLEEIIDSYLQSDLGEVWNYVTNDQVQRKLEAVTDGYETF